MSLRLENADDGFQDAVERVRSAKKVADVLFEVGEDVVVVGRARDDGRLRPVGVDDDLIADVRVLEGEVHRQLREVVLILPLKKLKVEPKGVVLFLQVSLILGFGAAT